MSESKTPSKRLWEASKSQVERVPNTLVVSYEQPGIMPAPHWHAQVEINYMFRGALEYRMRGHSVELKAGQFCLFWGGLPHQVVDTDERRLLRRHPPAAGAFLPAATARASWCTS